MRGWAWALGTQMVTVEIWGNNLADKLFYQVAFDAPFQYNQIDAFLGDPRTFGITLRTKF